MTRLFALLLLVLPVAALADNYDDAVQNPSRPENDLARDALRDPATVLRTIGIDEGLVVLDVGAGGGYYSELFSYLVGDSGNVFLQNPSQLYELFGTLRDGLNARLADNRLLNAQLLEAESTTLGLPDESIDLAFFHLIYHDHFWLYPDQIDALNEEIQRVLKPGGRLVVIDHEAAEGAGASGTLTREGSIHRLEDAYVEEMLTEAGFELVESSDALRVPEDDHSKPFFAEEMRGKPTDRFFHIYRK